MTRHPWYGGDAVGEKAGGQFRRALVVAIFAALIVVPAGFADSVTIAPEADTFVRSGDAVGHGGDATFDVHGGASSYGCGTGPAFGLLRFDLDAIPAGATVTSATLELTSLSGFAFDGDPSHRALFLSDDTWSEGSVVWPGPANGVTQVAPPADWTIFGVPFGTSPNVLGAANAFTGVGCGGADNTVRNFNTGGSVNLASRISAERAGDTKLSLQIHSRPCGTPFSVVCQNGQLEQAYFLRYASKEGGVATAPRLNVTYTPGVASAPTLVRAVPTGGNTTVVGRVDGGAANLTFLSSPTCVDGVLGGTPTTIGAGSVTPDANGYFSAVVGNVNLLSFVAAKRTGSSDVSPCVVAKAANDQWPTAFGLTGAGTLTTQDVIDAAGQSKWYAFDIQPGSEVRVNISNLPADYDLALFKDITQAYTDLTSPQDLTRLSAEYAPSIFSPSIFSPSIFSPSIFSPDAYAPSIFSPSIFSPSIFSPSIFSPSIFSPSIYSPSIFRRASSARRSSRRASSARRSSRPASSARASSARTPLQAPRRGASSPPRRHPARPTSSSSRTRGATRAGTTCGSRAAPARSAPTARTR